MWMQEMSMVKKIFSTQYFPTLFVIFLKALDVIVIQPKNPKKRREMHYNK